MLTFRKALVLAVFIFTIIYLFKSSHHHANTPTYPTNSGENVLPTEPEAKAKLQTGSAAPAPTRLYPPPRSLSKDKKTSQKTLNKIENSSLLDRLRFQFPYDPDGKFPAYIWQTWKSTPASSDFGDELRGQEASWTELHPDFVHEVITDQTAVHLIRYLYASIPEVLEAYSALPVPVLKADYFRYLILLARGGIYSDIDTQALKSAVDWIPKEIPPSSIGLIVGIEADPDRPDWHDWYSRRIQFCQWTIQAKVGHPVLRSIVATVTEDTLRMKSLGILSKKKIDKSIVEFTGPAVWTDAVFNYLNSPDYFKMESSGRNITWENFTGITTAKKVGDVVVLPITSFSPGVGQMGAEDISHPMAFVKHDFEGKSHSDI
ncbi:membrane-bound alpha-1,6- mannosyltransferase Initiation-specific [Ptychographa xylographoides]|nr:membrane-bound alpha-1,6- mannosyltransferase Initiation-specific [Ptychographa xylographoides]